MFEITEKYLKFHRAALMAYPRRMKEDTATPHTARSSSPGDAASVSIADAKAGLVSAIETGYNTLLLLIYSTVP